MRVHVVDAFGGKARRGEQLVELRRIEYDIWTAQDKIVEAGLPQRLADRLALGK